MHAHACTGTHMRACMWRKGLLAVLHVWKAHANGIKVVEQESNTMRRVLVAIVMSGFSGIISLLREKTASMFHPGTSMLGS